MAVIVNADVPCASCGYNLRTLPAIGRCPECASPVEQSLRLALGRAGTYGLEARAADITNHATLQIAVLILVVFVAFVPMSALWIYPGLIIWHAILTFAITATSPGQRQATLARCIRIGVVGYIVANMLAVLTVAVGIMTDFNSGLVFIPIILIIIVAIAPSAIMACKGHYIARLCRRESLNTLSSWSIGISYFYAASLLGWMACLFWTFSLTRTPQSWRMYYLITTSVLAASACVAACIFYFRLAQRFRKIAAGVNVPSFTVEQPDETPVQPA